MLRLVYCLQIWTLALTKGPLCCIILLLLLIILMGLVLMISFNHSSISTITIYLKTVMVVTDILQTLMRIWECT